jgi:hypothetical protein
MKRMSGQVCVIIDFGVFGFKILMEGQLFSGSLLFDSVRVIYLFDMYYKAVFISQHISNSSQTHWKTEFNWRFLFYSANRQG